MFSKPPCVVCKKLAELKNKEYDCSKCLPDLFPENIDAIRVWGLVADQRIYAGMDGISMGLRHDAVWKLIDEFEIKERIETFEKVLKVYDAVRELEQKKRDEMEKK